MAENDPWAEFKAAAPSAGASEGVRAPSSTTSDVDPWAEFKPAAAPKTAAQKLGESSTLFGDAKAETFLGEIGAGVQKGVRQVISTAPALASLATSGFENVTGVDTRGLDEAFMNTAVEIAEGGAKRGIGGIEDLKALDPSTWARYVAGTLGETVPFVASILMGAGGAQALASLMAKKGVSSATRAGILSSIPAAAAGGVLTATAIETGATGQELYKATKDLYPGTSLLTGSAKGALESVFPLALGRALGLTGGQATNLLDRMLQSPSRMARIATGAGVEAGTEALQEEADIIARNFVDENFEYLSPETNLRRANALAGGFVGGSFFSAFHGSNPQQALNDSFVRQAAGDVPYLIGAAPNELPVEGPESAIDASLPGLDATVGVANLAELDELQSTVDIRRRGLYAAAIPGVELTFGSQDQALNDGGNAQIDQYLRLDPDKITRGDISVSVEDLPDTIASPRVDFTSPATMKEASSKLVEAIKWKTAAIQAKSVSARENNIRKAAAAYREAMNFGARVEPFPDSQIVLRDPTKHQALMQAQGAADLQSMVTKAHLKETRKRPGGGEFYVLRRPKGEEKFGKAIDLERVRPSDITAFPSRDLARQVQADQQIARKLDLGRAKAKGIRFDPKLDEAGQKAVLGEFVRFLQSAGKVRDVFEKMPAGVLERFMVLTDKGLRLDVTADTPGFALLRKLAKTGFAQDIDVIGPEVLDTRSAGTRRLVKQRARRDREPRVSKRIAFADDKVQVAFMSQFHNSPMRTMLAGEKGQGKNSQNMNPDISPLADMIRDIVKPMGLKTDIVIEIVPPGFNPSGKGVHYEDKTIVLSPGKKGQSRSVLQVDPWAYAQQTEGKKPLTINPATKDIHLLAKIKGNEKFGVAFRILPMRQSSLNKVKTTVIDASKTYPGATHVLATRPAPGKPWKLVAGGSFQDLYGRFKDALDGGRIAAVEGVDNRDAVAWSKDLTGQVPLPVNPFEGLSEAGKAAQEIGAPDTKLFVEDQKQAEFVTDIAHEVSKIIVTHEWDAMGAAQQELFKTAYRREKHAVQGQKKEVQLSRVIAHPILERTIGEQRGRNRHAYNFEEWLVSHITRWMVQPNTPLGPVQSFFQKVAKKVEKFIQTLYERIKNKEGPWAQDRLLGRPAAVVEDWLRKLEQRGVVTQEEPFLSKATRDAVNASIAANRAAMDALGIDESVAAFPQRASTFRVKQLLKLFPKDAYADRAKVKGLLAMADRHNTMLEWLLGVHQLSALNPHIAGLKAYTSLNRAMENVALSWASLADKRIRQVQVLGKEMGDNLWRFMFELDRMSYLDQKKLEEGTEHPRWPNAQELLTLAKGHKLSKEAFDAYVEIRQDFLQFLSYLEEVSIQKAIETVEDPAELAKEISTIAGEVSQMKARPYMPHMRFGKYAVTVRGEGGKVLHFEAFATKGDRDRAIVEIEKKYGVPRKAEVVEDELSPTLQQWQGLPPFALRNIMRELGLDAEDGDLTVKQKKDKKLLEALALQAAPTTSFRRQMLERQNTPGFSNDGMRAYGTYFARAGRYVARQEYTKRLEASIKDVRDSGSPISKDARTRIADYMTRHYENLMNPSSDWAEARAAAYMWYFAFVPAAAFINLTQVPMVAMPYLANKFGDMATMGKVTAAYGSTIRDYFNELRGKQLKDEGVLSEAIEEAHESRLIDDGFAQELAAISQGAVLQRTISASKWGRELRRVAQWGVAPFTLAERINRAVTFRAAYKMALADNNNPHVDAVMAQNEQEASQLRVDRGWDEPHLRAYMVAADAVRTSQFEYSRWARPKLMEGPRGVLLMFKSYVQNMLFFLFKQDRGAQARMLLTLMATAGIMGLPGAEDAEELAKWLMRQFGISFDGEKMLRGLMTEWAEGIPPDIVLHGASRVGFGMPAALSGLGIPSGTPDLSASLSMGKLIPGLQMALNPETSSWRETVGNVTSEVAGPWLGVPFAMYQSAVDASLPADDIKRWERAMPRALRGVMRSSRIMAEQRERDRGGATVVQFDPNDASDQADIASIALGFAPTQMNRQWDYLRAQTEVQRYWQSQRTILMNELFRAKRLKDKDGMADAVEAIKEFNKEAPDKALRITSDSLRRSMRTQGRNLELRERGIPKEERFRGVSGQVDLLYPEAVTRREKVPKVKDADGGL